MVQMIFFHIGNHGHPWMQIQKRTIAFICFRYQIIAISAFGIAANLCNFTAYNNGRIFACQLHSQRNHRRCGGLSVSTGYTDCLLFFHQLCQHLRTMQYRQPQFFYTHIFFVGFTNRCRTYCIVNIRCNIFRTLPYIDLCTLFLQPFCHVRHFDIRTGNTVAKIQQNFCNTAHTNTADSHKINMFHFIPLQCESPLHFRLSIYNLFSYRFCCTLLTHDSAHCCSTRPTICASASRLPMAKDCAAICFLFSEF